MPLPTPTVARRHLHTRQVICQGYQREDGLWEIEAQMVDSKTYSFPNKDRGGQIQAGEALHEMWLRLTLDEQFTVIDAVASTEHSPFHRCHAIPPAYTKLIGLRIGPGWNRKVKELFANSAGCTHITELLGPVATTAFQTLHAQRHRDDSGDPPPRLLDSCYALARDGEVVLREWPRHYTGKVNETV